MTLIKGITVTLINKQEIGRDPFDKPIVEDVETEVDNVLVSPTSTDEIVNQLNIDGKKAVYTLAIPNDDVNNWADGEGLSFGARWRTFGIPIQGRANVL